MADESASRRRRLISMKTIQRKASVNPTLVMLANGVANGCLAYLDVLQVAG